MGLGDVYERLQKSDKDLTAKPDAVLEAGEEALATVLGEELAEDVVELAEQGMSQLCINSVSGGCIAWAIGNTSLGFGYTKRYDKNYKGCLKEWCG